MKLQRFIKNKKQKQILIGTIIGIIILIGGITLYRTFALYKAEKSFDVIKGIVPDFSSGDVTLAFTVNKKTESGVAFPNRNEGFKADGVTCENNVLASWDEDNWALKIENSNKNSRIKCTINFKRYEESILNGAYPVLKEGLVPVKIDDNGTVTKANIEENWYEYSQKKWANAVILVDGKTEANYKEGQTIPETDIESYFVWIPKYKYKIFDMGDYSTLTQEQDKNNNAVEIKFGIENTTDTNESCTTPTKSGDSGSCAKDKWMTHPAFLAFDTNGLWVGKFETGYKQDGEQTKWSKTGAEKDTNDSTKVIIKPNVYSWRAITLGNAFKNSKEYKENLDSHMMKNTEWGAVAYLIQSKYGSCKKENEETICTNVALNKDGAYRTAYNDTQNVYPNSKEASTTGNNTGIFDMSGGAWESVANAMYKNDNSSIEYGTGGLDKNILNDNRYYDIYEYGTTYANWNRRILGDATGELGPFGIPENLSISSYFKSTANFVNKNIYFMRGGAYFDTKNSGVFAFTTNDGLGYVGRGFRIVLAPQ